MIEIRELDNGVRVVMENIPYVKSAALGIWVRTGAVDETPDNSGISHFVEHMMFKGTKKRSAKEIAEEVDSLGGHINAFTGREATCYYIKTLESNLDEATDILLDMFMNSAFETGEMKRERGVICEEIKMIKDTPDEDANDSICELVFKGNKFGKSIVGTPASLRKIDHDIMKKYISDEYVRGSIVVSAAGKFDKDVLCERIEKSMKRLKAKKKIKAEPEWKYRPRFKVKEKDIEQTHICMAVRSVDLEDDRYPALMLLSNVMGGSMSSRLFQNVREQKGLAYSVFSMNSSFSTDGYFNIYAGVGNDKADKAINAIKEELAALDKEGITEAELAKAKEQMKSSFIFSQENVNSRMFSMGNSLTIIGRVRTPEEIVKRIDNVTMDDIRDVAELITDIGAYSGVAVTGSNFDLKKYIREI